MTQLTLHFTLEELVFSERAIRESIDNTPSPEIVDNLRKLARALEHVRSLLGGAILISSGYRSPELNRAVKGSKDSAHMRGLAADFICPRYGTPRECALSIARSDLIYDQVIWEGTWVHFALRDGEPRQEEWTATFGALGPSYSRGIA